MDPILGQIILFAGSFAPVGWAFCNGQLLPIQQYAALFSLLGTVYGGDGRTTFALPDLRGRAPIHFGQGNGLSAYALGATGGTENVTLLSSQMPMHAHGFSIACDNSGASETDPTNNCMGTGGSQIYSKTSNAAMQQGASTSAGNNQPHENRAPFIAMNYIIAVNGLFPQKP